MKVIYAFFVLLSASAFADAPKCVNVGTRSEGWEWNGRVKFAACLDRVAFCGAIGTRSEGYYSGAVKESKLLGFDNCSETQARKPKCVNQGTRSEGWRTPNGTLHFDNCSQKHLACLAQGTRSEGWYAVTIDESDKELIGWTQCSELAE
jgi:hypothetical protein